MQLRSETARNWPKPAYRTDTAEQTSEKSNVRYRMTRGNTCCRPQPDRRLVRAAVVQAAAPSLKPAGYPIHTPRPIWPLAQYVKLAAIRRLDDLRGSSDLSDSLWVAVDRQSLSER